MIHLVLLLLSFQVGDGEEYRMATEYMFQVRSSVYHSHTNI